MVGFGAMVLGGSIVLGGATVLGIGNTTETSRPIVNKIELSTAQNTRVMNGYYCDYMCITTEDGNYWLLDADYKGNNNPYIKADKEAVFDDGEAVQVVFDTKGTESVLDDEIIKVHGKENLNSSALDYTMSLPYFVTEYKKPERRFMTGNYYDYMCITTVDGNDWLLDENGNSPYVDSNKEAIFEEGEMVQVVFDTKGTETIMDDEIIKVVGRLDIMANEEDTEDTEDTAMESTIYTQERRVMTGNYYDYLCITTVDGNDWLLDENGNSPYIDDNMEAIFEDGEMVQVVFDTKGTETVLDDEIVKVISRIDIMGNVEEDMEDAEEGFVLIPQEKRVMTGNYYDDTNTIVTVDENEWELSSKENTFSNLQLVQVVFDAKGTASVLDDEIIEVIGR